MILANELRLENIVQDELGNTGVVKQINGERYMKHDGVEYIGSVGLYIHSLSGVHGRWIQKLKPIKLTEEILLKCGFRGDKEKLFLSLPNLAIEIHAILYIGQYVIEINNHIKPIVTECEYLHELQNLVYALSKREMEVKLC